MDVLGETAGFGRDDGLTHGGDFRGMGTGVGGNLWAEVRGGLVAESWEGLGGTGQGSDLGGWYGSGARGDNGLRLSSAASGGLLTSGWITGRRITHRKKHVRQ